MKFIIIIAICLCFVGTLRSQNLSKAQAIEDIDYYNKVLHEVHYNPYLYANEKSYQQLTKAIKDNLKDSVSLKSFNLIMSRLTAGIKDGHTMPMIAQQQFRPDFNKKIYFPLEFVADKKDFLYLPLQAEQFNIPTGAIVTAVNGLNLQKFYKETCAMIGGLPEYRRQMALNLMGSFLYLTGIKPPFKVDYNDKGKKNSVIIQQGITYGACLTKALPQLNNKPYGFKVVKNKIGYMELNAMKPDFKVYQAFFDSCFTTIAKAGINTMVIDLRKNLGGNSQIGDLLISYFNKKPYSLSSGRFWRVSQKYKDFLTANGDSASAYHKELNNSILDSRKCGARDPLFINNMNFFDGKVYIITGPMTFSSANMLADAIKGYHMATIVGQPTGENTNDFGEAYRMELPNSKLNIQTTVSFDFGVDCNPNTSHPVIPDKTVEVSLNDKILKTDPVLEYILQTTN